MLISKADQALLASHQVQIDVQGKCGLMTIQGRKYTITLLTPNPTTEANNYPSSPDPIELSKEQMINTASKIAIILLKKELLQKVSPDALSSFKIDGQGIKTVDAHSEKEIKHEDAEIEKDTRIDYNALMDYLAASDKNGNDAVDDTNGVDEHEHETPELPEINATAETVLEKEEGIEEPQETKELKKKARQKIKKKKGSLYDIHRKTTKMSQPPHSSSQSSPFKEAFKTEKEPIRKRPAIKAKKIEIQKNNSGARNQFLLRAKKTREKTSSLFLERHQSYLGNSQPQVNPPLLLMAPPKREHDEEILPNKAFEKESVDIDIPADVYSMTEASSKNEEVVQEVLIPVIETDIKNLQLAVRQPEERRESISRAMNAKTRMGEESFTRGALVRSLPTSLGLLKPPLFYPFLKSSSFSLPSPLKTRLTSTFGGSTAVQMAQAMRRGFLPIPDQKLIGSAPPISSKKEESPLSLFSKNDDNEDLTKQLFQDWQESQPQRHELVTALTGDLFSMMGPNHHYQYLPIQPASSSITNRFIAPPLSHQGNIPEWTGTVALITVAASLVKMIRRGLK